MFEEIKNRKAGLGYVWVKASDSGTTYLVPASADIDGASDADLRGIGIDESRNPHND